MLLVWRYSYIKRYEHSGNYIHADFREIPEEEGGDMEAAGSQAGCEHKYWKVTGKEVGSGKGASSLFSVRGEYC
jgi:hypothetical protein